MKPTALIATLALFACANALGTVLDFPAPKDAALTVVGRDMTLNGVNMSAWELRSEASADSVLQFYRDLWAKNGPEGGRAYAEQPYGKWVILTHVDDRLVYTVQVLATGSKKGAEGLLGISDVLKQKPTEAKSLARDFPKPAGSQVQNDLVAHDLGVVSRTIVMTSPASVKQNLEFYARWFEQNGWTIEDGMRLTEDDQAALVASNGGDRWQLTFSPRDRDTSMVAVLEER